MSKTKVIAAREQLIRQVIRLLSSERGDETNAHYADDIDYAQELIALAARDLVEATDALPSEDQPVGWNRTDPLNLNVGDWVTVALRKARVEGGLFDDESQQYLTIGHDAVSESFPLALTDDVTVTFLATEDELREQARTTSGGAA